MRDSFHKLKWILLAVIAAFVFGFVFLDMGLRGATSAGADENRTYAARVNGEMISYSDYTRAYKNIEDNYRQMYGGQWTPELAVSMGLQRQVVDSLVDQRLLLQEAERLNLTATPEEIRDKIRELPVFNEGGKFVGAELYTRYVTGPLGYPNAAAFEADVAKEITLTKMESALANSIVISPKAAEAEYRRTSENAKIRYVLYPSSRESANVTVTPAEVDQFYKNNQLKYSHGEQRQIKYLIADYSKLRAQVIPSDADVKRRYDASKENYKSGEAAQVQHILVKVEPTATPQQDAAAKAEAEQIVAQLRAGADFATLARQHSDDPSSSNQGGEMGFVEKGATVEAFEQAIFSIPLNQISDPIRTPEYGYHIVKVTARRPPSYRPFEEVKAQIAAAMADDTAKAQARESINGLATRLRSTPPKTAEEFAALGNDRVTANASEWFSKGDSIPGIGYHAPLVQWAFSANVGAVGEVIGTQRGMVIPYLSAVRGAGVTPLTEIRAKVENDARLAKAQVLARNVIAQAAASSKSLDEIATKTGLAASEATVTRQGYVAGFTGDTTALIDAAMNAPAGQISGPVLIGDGALMFQVVEQKRVDAKELAENREQHMEMLRQQQSRSLRTVLLQRLKKEANVDINEELLREQSAQQQGV
ncbi:MAG TPA: peptidylprolyl isomerase [Thermoanaerobaculia bacterium]